MQSLWRDAGAAPLPGSTEGEQPFSRKYELEAGRSGGPFKPEPDFLRVPDAGVKHPAGGSKGAAPRWQV